MLQPTQAPSDEDLDSSRICLHTIHDAVTRAVTHFDAPDHEWLLAFFFDEQYALLGEYEMYRGHQCSILTTTNIQAMLVEAAAHHTAYLVTVRHHPHPWMPKPIGGRRFEIMQQQAAEARIPLRIHVVLDSTGMVFPLRLRESGLNSQGKSGSLVRSSVPD